MARLLQAMTASGPRMTQEQLRFLEEHLTPWSSKRVRAEQRLTNKMKRERINKAVRISKRGLLQTQSSSGRTKLVRIRPERRDAPTRP